MVLTKTRSLKHDFLVHGLNLPGLNVHFLTRYLVQGGPGSVRFGYGLGMERFERFRFSVPAVPLRRGLFWCFSVQFHREDGSGSGFGSWRTVPAVPVPRSVPAKTVLTVPLSGSGSVPGPPC